MYLYRYFPRTGDATVFVFVHAAGPEPLKSQVSCTTKEQGTSSIWPGVVVLVALRQRSVPFRFILPSFKSNKKHWLGSVPNRIAPVAADADETQRLLPVKSFRDLYVKRNQYFLILQSTNLVVR